MVCNRCGRKHSGICGIPSIGVKIGIGGTGIRRSDTTVPDTYPIDTKNPRRRRKVNNRSLEELLAWGKKEEKRCLEMLKVLPTDLTEYDIILGKLDRLMATIRQIEVQIAERI